MKKKPRVRDIFLNRCSLLPLMICGAALFLVTGTLLALVHKNASPQIEPQTLTFSERVAYQRAIEDVYWRHRIWPKERPDLKPSLDVVMSQSTIEKKVQDYLRNSELLQQDWQKPISADQLQTEMERMASHTKQP